MLAGIEERKPRLSGGNLGPRHRVEQEERREQAPARGEHARGLGQVVVGLVLEQVRVDGCGDHEVEAPVVVGKAVFAGGVRAARVIAAVVEIGDPEAEVRVRVPVAPPAPADRVGADVEAVVGAAPGIEVARERPGHPPDPATDVEHALVRLEARQVAEVVEELVAGLGEVAPPHELQAPGRHERVAARPQAIARVERAQSKRGQGALEHCPYPSPPWPITVSRSPTGRG